MDPVTELWRKRGAPLTDITVAVGMEADAPHFLIAGLRSACTKKKM